MRDVRKKYRNEKKFKTLELRKEILCQYVVNEDNNTESIKQSNNQSS